MKIKAIKLLFIILVGVTLTSCGTIAGVGKDIQSIGRTMEKSEHKRVMGARTTPVPRTVYASSYQPSYPSYPTGVTQ